MSKRREQRYATAEAMLLELEAEEAEAVLDSINDAVEDNDMEQFEERLRHLDSSKAQLQRAEGGELPPGVLESYPQSIRAVAGIGISTPLHRLCFLGRSE